MTDLWALFWHEFTAQSLFNQLSFVIPLLGLPTLLGIFSNWSTKTRLRKLADGRAAEVALLTAERDALREQSLRFHIAESEKEEGNESLDFREVFEKNRSDISLVSRTLAVSSLVDFWRSENQNSKADAAYFAKVALALEPTDSISAAVTRDLDSGGVGVDYMLEHGADLAFPVGSDSRKSINLAVSLILQRECEPLLRSGDYESCENVARFFLIYLQYIELLYSEAGYHAAYYYMHALEIRAAPRNRLNNHLEDLLSIGRLFLDISVGTFPENHLSHFVSSFHYTTALHAAGRGSEALGIIEGQSLCERAAKYVGPRSSAALATRHLYANLLYEAHRSEEAKAIVDKLKEDLTRFGIFSKGHKQTYDHWRYLSETPGYRRGKDTRFANKGHLTYPQ